MSVFTSLQRDAPDVRGICRALSCIFLSILSCFFMGFIASLFANQGVITLILMIALGFLSSLLIGSIGFCCNYWGESRHL